MKMYSLFRKAAKWTRKQREVSGKSKVGTLLIEPVIGESGRFSGVKADDEFHRLLVVSCGNGRIARIAETIMDQVDGAKRVTSSFPLARGFPKRGNGLSIVNSRRRGGAKFCWWRMVAAYLRNLGLLRGYTGSSLEQSAMGDLLVEQ